jgi:hypothetical protein
VRQLLRTGGDRRHVHKTQITTSLLHVADPFCRSVQRRDL